MADILCLQGAAAFSAFRLQRLVDRLQVVLPKMVALRAAAARLGNYRLLGTTLYVTLEPCPMCAGAMVHARIARVVYGAPDPRAGAAGTVFELLRSTALNHRADVTGGILADECGKLLQDFFRARRSSVSVISAEQPVSAG